MLEYLSLLFESSWDMFSITWPGFDFPISYVFLGIAFAAVALKVFGQLFDISLGSSISGLFARGQRGGNNRNIKVSKERKGDEK